MAAQEVTCPLCGGATKPWGSKNTFTLVRCVSCGVGFVSPLPTSTDTIYGGDYFFGATEGFGYVNYDEDKKAMLPTSRAYLEMIEKRCPSKGRLLDVGAATGQFVALAAERGWNAEGVEISSQAVAAAQSKGIPIRLGSIHEIQGEGIYDAITFLDVLEHLPDPMQAIRDAEHLLKPGGVLAVNVPDAGSAYAKLMGLRWHAVVPPEHLFYFTAPSLSQALAKGGFGNIEKKKINKSFSLPYFVSTFGRWVGSQRVQRWAEKMKGTGMERVKLFVPLYDNLMVVGKKKVYETFSSEYTKDFQNKRLTDCCILFSIRVATPFPDLEIQLDTFKVAAHQSGGELRVLIQKKLPISLINDLRTVEKSSLNFLIGIIDDAMPLINEKVRETKYSTAQVVSRTLSIFDVRGIVIASDASAGFRVSWPVGFEDFPYLQDPKRYDFVYIRDLIEAMTSYLYYDYDESLRKIITSLDNALKHYKVKDKIKIKWISLAPKELKKKLWFKSIMDQLVFRPELNYNIKKVYDIRNGIVHDQLRLGSKQRVLIKKSIATLLYIYKMYLNEDTVLSRYISQIEAQFSLVIQSLGGLKIEFFQQEKNCDAKILTTPQEVDEWRFSSLRFSDDELPS